MLRARASKLPPEPARPPALFPDLPGEGERAETWCIHIARRERDPKFGLGTVVRQTDGFTGSEIEQAFRGFYELENRAL